MKIETGQMQKLTCAGEGESDAGQCSGSPAGAAGGWKAGWEVDTGSLFSIHFYVMPVNVFQSLCRTLFVHKYIPQPPLTHCDTSEKQKQFSLIQSKCKSNKSRITFI